MSIISKISSHNFWSNLRFTACCLLPTAYYRLPTAFCLLLTAYCLLSSCKKDVPDDYYNPTLSNLEVSLDTVREFADTVLITFDYIDMDGDLGFHDPNVNSLSVKDSRFLNPDMYHVQPLAPENSEVKINGSLTVKLNGLFVVGNAPMENLYFTIQITDRKSHKSNELVSKEIVVVRQ